MSNEKAIVLSDVYYIEEKLTLEEAKLFISNQTKRLREIMLNVIIREALGEIKELVESDFLSENDVSEHCKEDILEEVQELRGDACNDLVREFESMLDHD